MFDEMGQAMEDAASTGDELGGPGGIMGKMEKWVPITMALAIGSLLFSTLVLVCAVLVLIWHRSVPRLVPAAMMATVAYTVLQTGVTMYSQYDMMSWTSELAGGGGGTGFDGIVGMSLGFSLCVPGGWAFLKIAFFVYVAMHLRKPEVVQLFGGQAPAIGPRGD